MSGALTSDERVISVEIETDPESGMSFKRGKARSRKDWPYARTVKVPESTLARWEAAHAAWAAATKEMYEYLVEAGGHGW